jgi:hypothetical protein
MHVEGAARKLIGRLRWLLPGLTVLLAGLTGCKSKVDVVSLSQSEQNLTHIALAYKDAHTKLDRPPKNVEELKPLLKDFGNPEELLVSPNDGQPYVIVWGADPTRGGPTEYKGMFPILAYEQKGSGGRRAVTDIRGRPMTVPEEDFAKLTFVRGHKPSSP